MIDFQTSFFRASASDSAAANSSAADDSPDSDWLGERDLAMRGFHLPSLRAAVEAGELRGRLLGGMVAIRQGDLFDWLERGSTPTPAAKAVTVLRSVPSPVPGSIPPRGPTVASAASGGATSAATDEFAQAIARREASGMSRPAAVAATVRSNPELQVRMLSEANGRVIAIPQPAARTAIERQHDAAPPARRPAPRPSGAAMSGFLSAVQRLVDSGIARPLAVRRVVHERQSLHAAALAEQHQAAQ